MKICFNPHEKHAVFRVCRVLIRLDDISAVFVKKLGEDFATIPGRSGQEIKRRTRSFVLFCSGASVGNVSVCLMIFLRLRSHEKSRVLWKDTATDEHPRRFLSVPLSFYLRVSQSASCRLVCPFGGRERLSPEVRPATVLIQLPSSGGYSTVRTTVLFYFVIASRVNICEVSFLFVGHSGATVVHV